MRDPAWRTGVLAHEGEAVYFEETGEGKALVLCHGAGGNHAVWYQQVAHFAPSSRVITWDQRGYGKSTREGEIGPRAAVRDLAALLDHLGVGQVHLVGQSMGGWCALGYALEHPARVRSLVLADTLAGVFTPEIVEILSNRVAPPLPPEPPLVGVHPAITGVNERNPAQAFLYQQLSTFGAEVPPLEAVALLLQTQWDLDAVRALDLPVLFLFGAEDNLFPPDALRLAAAVFARARVTEIPGTTHSPYFEAASVWNEAVEEFLRDQ